MMFYRIIIDHDNLEIVLYADHKRYRNCELIETDFTDDDSLDTIYYYMNDMGYECDPFIQEMFNNNY